ncbi:hypothetical protein CMI37_10555 [Candidatus Pacearchaeota archaeon]|nr:hypothetical protein [Candidatus Pacearchaeota archaeon]|tara:strand:- start:490 stop:684 length:195 start_codon:yes stop_codon:yes gene_type:complete
MTYCRYYKGKHEELCRDKKPNHPECTKTGGFYDGRELVGCYKKAAALEKLAKRHKNLLAVLFPK